MTATHPLTTTQFPLNELTTYHRNPRRGNVPAIAASLQTIGQYRPIVVNLGRLTGRPLEVLAGNHTLLAARDLGWDTITGATVDVDDETAARIVAADNRTADLGDYDLAQLLELLADLPDLTGTGYADDDLAKLAADLAPDPAPIADPDGVPEVPAEPRSVLGDVWVLGPHRVVCGDSTDVGVHDALLGGVMPDVIFTDPPYGMDVDVDYGSMHSGGQRPSPVGRYQRIHGDDQPFDASGVIGLFDAVREQFWWGADYYRTTIPSGGSWVVWDKRGNDQGMNLDALIGGAFELCWSRQSHKRDIARVLWAGHHGMQRVEEDTKKRVHPTQKPVALVMWFLDRYTKPGNVVLDLYAGSGSTLMGCYQTGRVARLIELDCRYVDVICRRYQEATGVLPVLESTGEAVDFTQPAEAA